MLRLSDKYSGSAGKKLVPIFLSLSLISLLNQGLFYFKTVIKIGQASMNQNLMVVGTKLCSLLFDLYPRIPCEASLEDCRLQVPFESVYWSLCESSLYGFSHQVMFRLILIKQQILYLLLLLFLYTSRIGILITN